MVGVDSVRLYYWEVENVDEYVELEVVGKTLSPVVSGEVKADRVKKTNVKLVRITGDGKVSVPIYGAMRAYLEKTLRENGEEVCDTGTGGGCGKCILCDLFGSLQARGRAIIDDLKSEEDYNSVVDESVHLRLNRETNAVSQTLKMEEIREGTTLRGYIRIVDPKERDEELIVAALKAIEEFGVAGWMTRGRGRLSINYTIKRKRWSDFLTAAKEELMNVR